MGMKPCPDCGGLYEEGDKFCIKCGARLEPEDSLGALGPLIALLNMFPGVIRPKVVIFAPVASAVGLVLIGMAGALMMLAPFPAFAIGALGLLCYWAAVCWLMYGDICMPAEALADFDSTQWFVFVMMTALPASIAFWRLKASG